MKRTKRFLLGASAAWILSTAAHADIVLNSVRVGAPDTEALARFYIAAFGMRETNRLDVNSGAEIFLNFGETPEAARNNTSPRIVLMPSDADASADPIAHVIFNVTDAAATVTAAKAAGGTVMREPTEYGNTGIIIAFVVDPAGNQVELIQRP